MQILNYSDHEPFIDNIEHSTFKAALKHKDHRSINSVQANTEEIEKDIWTLNSKKALQYSDILNEII